MNPSFQILEFAKIKENLEKLAFTETAKRKIKLLEPSLSETEVLHGQKETTEARLILDKMGTPPLVSLEDLEKLILLAEQGSCLLADQLEYIEITMTAVRRLKDFLNRCKQLQISLPYYEENLNPMEELKEEIQLKIRSSRVDDHASKYLNDVRGEIDRLDNKMRTKADAILKNNKECFSESFITLRSGRICLPVKKEHKFRISGSVIDKSSTGATLFIEPAPVAKLNEELINWRLEEENEERRILYELTDQVAEQAEAFRQNIHVIEKLDFIFAKGKLSLDMLGIEPEINTNRYIRIAKGRHPFIESNACVPLDFEIGGEISGIIITGPNTGGKTVAIKTVGLLSLMAQSGLHVPCERGSFSLNNQVLCDIGDGQDITENLSTFSAHITNVLEILKKADRNSLVILDELGSGTDPTEGMGIAIAILEELRSSHCLFLATTHYPEVKSYAEQAGQVQNARMAFDRESLSPLYRLEQGEAGESCAFYIAKCLGMSPSMLKKASLAAYGTEQIEFLDLIEEKEPAKEKRIHTPAIKKKKEIKPKSDKIPEYQTGDSVMVLPDQKIGIVCKPVNEKGVLQVQMTDQKIWVNHKRVKLHVKADKLYPENYDFSIVFDTVENRKARHQMDKGYQPDLEIHIQE